MLIDQITPFVRFAAEQDLSHCWSGDGKELIGYDHRIYYVLSGRGYIKIDGVRYELRPDTFLMWRAGTTYSYFSYDNEPLICATCNFDFTNVATDLRIPIPPDRVKDFKRENLIHESVYFSDHRSFNDTIFIENASNIKRLMLKLVESYNTKLKFYILQCNNILQEILLSVAYKTDENIFSKNNELALSILDYIRLNYKNSPTNEEIGAKFGYHPNYINSLIVKHTGMSLHQYMIDCKLSYAMQLLLSSNKTIAEIAEEINIPDPQYFSRLFKKHFKNPPSSFRLNK